jgi:hypothetical protein
VCSKVTSIKDKRYGRMMNSVVDWMGWVGNGLGVVDKAALWMSDELRRFCSDVGKLGSFGESFFKLQKNCQASEELSSFRRAVKLQKSFFKL